MNDDKKFIASIRKQGKHAEDNLAMCDVLHLIKLVADGDLRHVDEAYVDLDRCVGRVNVLVGIMDNAIAKGVKSQDVNHWLQWLQRLVDDFADFEKDDTDGTA